MEVEGSSSRIRDKVWSKQKNKNKIKVTVFRFVIHFLSPELHSEELGKRKREERKKTAYFDEGAIFTLGSFVKLLLLPTAYVENPEVDDIDNIAHFAQVLLCGSCHQDAFLFLLLIAQEIQGTGPSHKKWRNDLFEL